MLTGCTLFNRSTDPPEDDEQETDVVKDETVDLESSDFGSISFVCPGDLVDTMQKSGPGLSSLNLFEDDLWERIVDNRILPYQKVLISGSGFNMVIGFNDYREQYFYNTYDMYRKAQWDTEDIQYGGLTGYSCLKGVLLLSFPAITQYGGRVIALYPENLKEFTDKDDLEEKSAKLITLPAVKEILNSLKFTGNMMNEERFETMPIINKYFSLTPTDGWEITFFDEQIYHYSLEKEGAGNPEMSWAEAEFTIEVWESKSPKDRLNDILGTGIFDDIQQLSNRTINGQEYYVVYSAEFPIYWLVSSPGAFNPNSENTLTITIKFIELDDVMPLFDNLTIK